MHPVKTKHVKYNEYTRNDNACEILLMFSHWAQSAKAHITSLHITKISC